MYFEYMTYVRICLNYPLRGLIMIVLGLLVLIWCAVFLKTDQFRGIAKFLMIFFILIGHIDSLCEYAGVLQHGGIYLAKEAESDAVQMEGYISHIEGLNRYQIYRITGDYELGDKKGYEFTINGIHCTAPAKGDLKVGDYVVVKYLPKSSYILYIDRTEKE